jgi:hypothetical protein
MAEAPIYPSLVYNTARPKAKLQIQQAENSGRATAEFCPYFRFDGPFTVCASGGFNIFDPCQKFARHGGQ